MANGDSIVDFILVDLINRISYMGMSEINLIDNGMK